METLEEYFEKSKKEIYNSLMKNYIKEMDKALDKHFCNSEQLSKMRKEFEELPNDFNLNLKWHIDKLTRLDMAQTFDTAVKDYYKGKSFKEIKPYIKEYGENEAWSEFILFVQRGGITINEDDLNSETISLNAKEFDITWSGLDKRDFLRIIYALIDSGYLQHKKGNKTKTIEEIARRLKFDLGNNWQSNFSNATSYNNEGYDPTKIFDDLKKAAIDKTNQV